MSDLYRPIRHVSITKVNDVPRESAIRLYCNQRGESWNLQVRGPATRADGREGADFIVANASCSADDLRELRDAIDGFLATTCKTEPTVEDRAEYAEVSEVVRFATVKLSGHPLDGHTVTLVRRDRFKRFVIVRVIKAVGDYAEGAELRLLPNKVEENCK
jgi:hypothetical protein